MANAAKKFDLIHLEALPWTSSIAESTPPEFCLDVLCSDVKPSGKTLNDGDESLTMAFTRSQVTNHAFRLSLAFRPLTVIYRDAYNVGSLPLRASSTSAASRITCASTS